MWDETQCSRNCCVATRLFGFIFIKSPRHFEGALPVVAKPIKKVGVLWMLHRICSIQSHHLWIGCNSTSWRGISEYMENLRARLGKLKRFGRFFCWNDFDFLKLKPYEQLANKFLFDTWVKSVEEMVFHSIGDLLVSYPYKKPFILSGGISHP